MTKKSNFFLSAAVVGLLSAGAAHADQAKDHHAKVDENAKGHCMGANACKGQSGCKTAKNACAGKNGCKGKGFVEKTKAECDVVAASDKTVHFEAAKK
jgi:hypothetical protein